MSNASQNGSTTWEIQRTRLNLPDAVWTQQRPVVAVSAGPGYGKSTLLSQWQRHGTAHGRLVIRLTAEPDDRSGDQLALQLAKALNWKQDGKGESVLDNYGSAGRQAMIKALFSELESRPGRSAIIIDDAHEVEQSRESALGLLLRYQPDDVALILAGRCAPGAATSKPLLEGRFYRFSTEQLALTKEETQEVLKQHGAKPTDAQITKLLTRTQGWPAAIRLFALSLEDNKTSSKHFFDGLESDGPQPLTDYLNDAFLSQQPAAIRDFLLKLSVLRGFSIPLAIAVTGHADAGTLMEDLERRGLPINRTDGSETRYALHPLVRDFLLQTLKRTHPDLLVRTRKRACEWLSARELIDAAIEVSLDTDDLNTAAAYINEHATQTVQKYGRHATYLHWIEKLPTSALSRFPEIRLKQAWSLDFVRRHDEAEAIRHELEQEFVTNKHATTPEFSAAIASAIQLQRCVHVALLDRAREATTRTRSWLANQPNASLFDKSTAHAVLAFSTKSLSDFEEGLKNARISQEFARNCDAPYIDAWAQMLAVTNLIKQGRYRQALQQSTEQITALGAQLGERSRAVTMLHALRAGVLYEFNQIPESSRALGRGLSTILAESSTDPMIVGYVTLARLQGAQGATLDSLETLVEGEALAKTRGLGRLAIALGAERVVQLLRHGEVTNALTIWHDIQSATSDGFNGGMLEKVLEDKSMRIDARTALLRGRNTEACEILAPILHHAKQTGQKLKEMEILVLQALALRQMNNHRKAFLVFSRALQIAMHGGFVRSLLDEGKALRSLMTAYRESITESAKPAPSTVYLDQILDTFSDGDSPQKQSQNTEQALVEALTSREIQILSHLQTGLSNRQLADMLFVTEGTLKWHLRNVYGKLGVTSRLAAVAKARELSLIAAE